MFQCMFGRYFSEYVTTQTILTVDISSDEQIWPCAPQLTVNADDLHRVNKENHKKPIESELCSPAERVQGHLSVKNQRR